MNEEGRSSEVIGSSPRVFVLPSIDPPEGFAEYSRFAHEFDGVGIEDWDNLREVAREVRANWFESGVLPDDLTLLRGVLLVQVRYARFIEGYPDNTEMPYLDDLVATIKELISRVNEITE